MQSFGEEQVNNEVFVEKLQIIFVAFQNSYSILKATSLFLSSSSNQQKKRIF